jgi:hypothetical protein
MNFAKFDRDCKTLGDAIDKLRELGRPMAAAGATDVTPGARGEAERRRLKSTGQCRIGRRRFAPAEASAFGRRSALASLARGVRFAHGGRMTAKAWWVTAVLVAAVTSLKRLDTRRARVTRCSSARRALHRQVPLIDGHNDFPWPLREKSPARDLNVSRSGR